MQHTSQPAGRPATSVPNGQSERPTDTAALLADLATLIDEIAAATAGGTALDARIHFGFRVAARRTPDIAALLIEQGITWATVEAVLDEQVPPYSTSLDAALDGEDICFVIRSVRRRRWAAMQKTRGGEEVLVWAASEPLARRLAAICAWRKELEGAGPTPGAPPATEAAGRDAPPPSGGEWEVMF